MTVTQNYLLQTEYSRDASNHHYIVHTWPTNHIKAVYTRLERNLLIFQSRPCETYTPTAYANLSQHSIVYNVPNHTKTCSVLSTVWNSERLWHVQLSGNVIWTVPVHPVHTLTRMDTRHKQGSRTQGRFIRRQYRLQPRSELCCRWAMRSMKVEVPQAMGWLYNWQMYLQIYYIIVLTIIINTIRTPHNYLLQSTGSSLCGQSLNQRLDRSLSCSSQGYNFPLIQFKLSHWLKIFRALNKFFSRCQKIL